MVLAMTYVFEASNVRCSIMVDGERRTIFSGLSFAIEPGEIVDIVGPSGAGKSSLLTAFARLNPRASGDLRLDGRSADDFTPQQWRAQVAYLPQKPVLLGETVAQAIRLPFTLAIRQSARTKQGPRRISPTDALPDGRIRETLDNMGCADIDLNRPPHDLSGGQAARVSLARTLLTRPKVLTTTPRKWRVSSPKRRRTAWRLFVSGTGRRMAVPHVSCVLPMARSRSPATPKRTVLRRVVLRRVTR